jgi:ribonucleoside-diphosphate reductase alpha chain
MDSFATAVSLALQYGVPLRDLVNKFSHLRFEPAGFTTNRDIPMAKSLVDYIFRYMATKFMDKDAQDQVGIINRQLTLSEAPAKTDEGAAAETTPLPITAAGAAPAPADSSPAAGTSESTQATGAGDATPGSEASAAQTAAVPVDAPEEAGSSLLDGLKVIAKNGHAEGDAGREERLSVGQAPVIFDTADSPACTECGSIMVRNGSCYKCINCGATSGCS